MIKRFVILRRKPGMSVEEFRHYWKNVHGPLIAKIPGLIKYVQHHVRSERLDDIDDPIDGIAELWFESEEHQRKAYDTQEYRAVVDDEPNLFEMNSHYVHPVMTEEIVDIV
jgi:uncharacterized protein (TIGR02118 family)